MHSHWGHARIVVGGLALGTCKNSSRGIGGQITETGRGGMGFAEFQEELSQVISLCLVTEGGPLATNPKSVCTTLQKAKLKTSEFRIRKVLLIEKMPMRRYEP